ncbi:MAG: hypothetical protein V1921_07935 [Candidatus Altiarchaeota archaeon]
MNKKSIVLLEDEIQVNDYLTHSEKFKGNPEIIALSPFAVYELDSHKVPYGTLEDYYDIDELYAIGLKNYQRVEEFSKIIDNKIQNFLPDFKKFRIKPASFNFYYLKVVYDAITTRLFQLSKLIEREAPDILYFYGTKEYPFGFSENAPYLLFNNCESVYSKLLGLDTDWSTKTEKLGIMYQSKTNSFEERKNISLSREIKKGVLNCLESHPSILSFVKGIRKGNLKLALHNLSCHRGADTQLPVLIVGNGYDWNVSEDQLQSSGLGPIFRIKNDLQYWINNNLLKPSDYHALGNVLDELESDTEFTRFFLWNDINFFPIVKDRLKFLVLDLAPLCLNVHNTAVKTITKKRIQAVLGRSFSTCIENSISTASQNLGIPVIGWQHGSCGYHEAAMVVYYDVIPPDYLFVYGQGVLKKYEEVAKHYATVITAIGSSTLDSLSNLNISKELGHYPQQKNYKKAILYVTTNILQNNMYVTWRPPLIDRCLWDTQTSILDLIAKKKDYLSLIKIHPNLMFRETPLRSYADKQGYDNCMFIRTEFLFQELFPVSDIIITDFPSTTLLQALTTTKPIFVYTGHLHIDKEAEDLLKRRAYCYPNLNEFTTALDTFLNDGKLDTHVDLKNREFLKMYGTHLDDGKSDIRAASALLDIINKNE